MTITYMSLLGCVCVCVSLLAWIVTTTVMVAFLSTDQIFFSSYSCGDLYVTCVLVVADMGAVNN
jgi:hypothetical protein